MPNEPDWLTPDEVIEINEFMVGETGEPFIVRDRGLLESALGRVQSQWAYEGEEDVAALSVSLLFAIAENHPFAQGNKRTGFAAALVFLRANGYDWSGPDFGGFAELLIDVLNHELERQEFEELFEAFVKPIN